MLYITKIFIIVIVKNIFIIITRLAATVGTSSTVDISSIFDFLVIKRFSISEWVTSIFDSSAIGSYFHQMNQMNQMNEMKSLQFHKINQMNQMNQMNEMKSLQFHQMNQMNEMKQMNFSEKI
jgi:hypothetical protein